MENKSSNGWKFFALLFGGLLAALVGWNFTCWYEIII